MIELIFQIIGCIAVLALSLIIIAVCLSYLQDCWDQREYQYWKEQFANYLIEGMKWNDDGSQPYAVTLLKEYADAVIRGTKPDHGDIRMRARMAAREALDHSNSNYREVKEKV